MWPLELCISMLPMSLSQVVPAALLFPTTQTCKTTLICILLRDSCAPSKGQISWWTYAVRTPQAVVSAVWISRDGWQRSVLSCTIKHYTLQGHCTDLQFCTSCIVLDTSSDATRGVGMPGNLACSRNNKHIVHVFCLVQSCLMEATQLVCLSAEP